MPEIKELLEEIKTRKPRATKKASKGTNFEAISQIQEEVGDYVNVLHADLPTLKRKNLKPGSNKWNQERRLEFIEYRLCWNNQINRADLVHFFGISIPQASLDLSKYIEMAPQNLIYDRRAKVYLKTSRFKPIYPEVCSPMNYLNDAMLFSLDKLNPNYTFLDKYPQISCFNPPARQISFPILSDIVYCIQNKRSIKIVYQSLTTSEPTTRVITPHALAFDGIRWHVRAFCSKHYEFRDFVLSRIQSVGKIEPSVVDTNEDMKWNFVVSLHIAANPELDESKRKGIEIDYGMENGEVVYKCRQAMLLYVLNSLRLTEEDEDFYKFLLNRHEAEPEKYKKPNPPQIILKNKEDIYLLLKVK